jgi:hypothetical protein
MEDQIGHASAALQLAAAEPADAWRPSGGSLFLEYVHRIRDKKNGAIEFGYNSPRWRVSMTRDFDLVVISGGPAGICGANTAGIFGKRVALVEKPNEVGVAGISGNAHG